MDKIQNIVGVVVHYNTPALLKKAIDSIREFYNFPIIVIDGSGDCDYHSESHLNHSNITVVNVGYNIGHGLGMDMGIKMAETDYVLTFDTDIEMNKPCIEEMMDKMKEDTYAIGKLYINTPKPYFYIENEELFDQLIVNTYVIHPSFQIVSKKEYLKYAPYISDGAPTVLSYHDIMRHEKEKECLVVVRKQHEFLQIVQKQYWSSLGLCSFSAEAPNSHTSNATKSRDS